MSVEDERIANGGQIHAQASPFGASWKPALGDGSAKPCRSDPCLRLLRHGDYDVRLLYVFVVIYHGSRRLLHFNRTAHPSAAWTLQQLREAIGFEDSYRYLIRDRDSIFAKSLDASIERLGLKI